MRKGTGGPRGLLTTVISTVAVVTAGAVVAPGASAQRREVAPPPPTLRAKPHQATYRGVLEVVGTVGGREQYRVGPDTVLVGIEAYENADGSMVAAYTLDLGASDPSVGTTPFSASGLDVEQWRPTLEALPFVSLLPLPDEPQDVGGEWARLSAYTLPDLELDFAEATRFWVESIEGEEVTIRYSAEGGGSTLVDQPRFGPDARMEVTRASAREGTFVFHLEQGRVLSSERLERITTSSVLYVGDADPQSGPEESQTLTFHLLPSSDPG